MKISKKTTNIFFVVILFITSGIFIRNLFLLPVLKPGITYLPNQHSRQYQLISRKNAAGLLEISQINDLVSGGRFSGLYYRVQNNTIIVVSPQDGVLRKYDLSTSNLYQEFSLGINCPEKVLFGKDGELVMGALACVENDPDYYFTKQVLFQRIGVWNTEDGSLISCFHLPCDGISEYSNQSSSYNGYVIDSEGKYGVVHDAFGYIGSALQGKHTSTSVNTMDIGDYLSMITFDSSGRFLALAFSDGSVRVSNYKVGFPVPIQFDESDNANIEIKDFAFSPNNQYLARIRGDNLSVWNVINKKLIIDEQILNSQMLSFNPSSGLLFVGIDDKIIVWDLQAKSILAQYETPDISILHISQDNRFLFWGDKLGIVHILGKKNNTE